MVKPLLGMCRVDPGDAFTYLSWSHIMSRSNFRIRENFFSNFTFYAYFYKGNFKAPVEKLFSAHLTKFFRRILKIFLISKTISTWVLEVFLDVSEQVFILNYDVWIDIRWNRDLNAGGTKSFTNILRKFSGGRAEAVPEAISTYAW